MHPYYPADLAVSGSRGGPSSRRAVELVAIKATWTLSAHVSGPKFWCDSKVDNHVSRSELLLGQEVNDRPGRFDL